MDQRKLLVGAVLVLALLGGVLVGLRLAGDAGDAGDADSEAGMPRTATHGLTAPPGTRLVGGGGIVVAIPEDWTTNEFRPCGLPARHTVIVDPGGPRRINCTPSWPTPPTLTIGKIEPVLRLVLGDVMHAPFDLGGLKAYRGRGQCPDNADCMSTRFPEYLVVPSRDVYFSVFGPARDDQALSRILDSAQPLPEGYAVVPQFVGRELVHWLAREAGIELRITTLECGPTDSCVRGVFSQSVPPGSVVPEGTEVAVTGY